MNSNPMGRLSKYKLDKGVEAEMFRLFWSSLSKLKSAEEFASFFSDLLTDTEEIMLAKRFAVAILLLRGKRPTDITSTLNVTFTTVGSVSAWLKNAKPQTQKVLERIIGEQNWQALLDRIDQSLDQIHPGLYTRNWYQAGKEKWKRTIERSTRLALR